MLLGFSSFFFFCPILLNLMVYWIYFFYINAYDLNYSSGCNETLNKKREDITPQGPIIIKIIGAFLLIFCAWLMTLRGYCGSFWFNHFVINNFIVFIVLALNLLSFIVIRLTYRVAYNPQVISVDYSFALANLSLFVPLLFLTNSLFSLFFILEINNVTIFYKLITARFWLHTEDATASSKQIKPNVNSYLHMLFLQYWVSFFSSILIVFVIIFTLYLYGTTDWIFLNLLNISVFSGNSLNYNTGLHVVLAFVLFFSFCLKAGFAPLQLYKVELYRGLPLIGIFFYTIYYFGSYFFFTMLLILYYYNTLFIIWWYLLYIMVVFGGLYVISLLFDSLMVRAFLAYSTIINALSFLFVVCSLVL